jgi:hypothetical protein
MTAAPGLADPNRQRSNRRVRPVPRGQAPLDTSRRRDHAAPACIGASTRRRYGPPHTRLTPTDPRLRRRQPGGPPGGMLPAVYARGIAPDVLVGTSAGALNASFVASRPQTATARTSSRVSGTACGARTSFRSACARSRADCVAGAPPGPGSRTAPAGGSVCRVPGHLGRSDCSPRRGL